VIHSLERQFDRVLLDTLASATIVVNDRMEIVHLRGNTSAYLEPPSGSASFNLSRVARDGLFIDLRPAIASVRKLGKPVHRKNVRIRSGGGTTHVDLEIRPVTAFGSPERYYLIAFRHPHPSEATAKPSAKPGRTDHLERRGTVHSPARQELARAREELRYFIEDHETTLEEFRAAQEELLSANEELQSVNEELETAKEELQSANEELSTMNEELSTRNLELVSAVDDLSNLFSNVSIPVVMVGSDSIVRRFTAQAQALLNLIPSDVGRRIGNVHTNLRRDNLADVASEVIASGAVHEEEVQASDGRWYLMRVRPYKTADSLVAGAVLAFQDIDLLKRSLDESRSYSATLIESARESIVILDSSLRVITANNSFYKTFMVSASNTEGRFIHQIAGGQWDIPYLRTALENLLAARARVGDFEVRGDFPHIGHKVMSVNARRIESQSGHDAILLAIEDLTELKRSEQTLRDLSTRLLQIQDVERRPHRSRSSRRNRPEGSRAAFECRASRQAEPANRRDPDLSGN
jgi:two-component system CheB/CheR fusion protein